MSTRKWPAWPPLYTNTPTSNNATYQAYNPFNWREDIARIDYRITDNQTLYFRYLHDNYNTIDPFGHFRFVSVARQSHTSAIVRVTVRNSATRISSTRI